MGVPPPPPPLALDQSPFPAPLAILASSLPFFPSLSSFSATRFSKTDQWRSKLWKLKELNLEHLKSPSSVYLTWLFFDLMANKTKYLGHDFHNPVSIIRNNRLLLIITFPRITGYYSRKYDILISAHTESKQQTTRHTNPSMPGYTKKKKSKPFY